MIKHTKNKRDWILIGIFTLTLGVYFLVSTFVIPQKEATAANIFYGQNSEPIVVIDFVNENIIIKYMQDETSLYPVVDLNNQTITLLGDFEIQGIRQEVVIGYSFERKSVEILEEESPYHICSNQGESSQQALICLPNAIRVEFTSGDIDFII